MIDVLSRKLQVFEIQTSRKLGPEVLSFRGAYPHQMRQNTLILIQAWAFLVSFEIGLLSSLDLCHL
ncbi:uncharacterized protein LY89DRAFT_682743 [Mollisia scopiformis]|uniref:Uncharacterized protein n=1 Tax=Mollisia scopiformis TaxID=149040 RepID=A0A194XJH6_MOLSC|nr:uncharacterized protein LY89DRAFT_682743 [Mollisia scopiformis]KUJ19912.1 hypothetical protein LY89DRAFT_682743 [Mollisia scopiformis]